MKKNKICFITTALGVGGAENMLLKLIENLDKNRFELLVISLTTKGVNGDRLMDNGFKVEALSMQPSFISLIKFFQLVIILRQFKPDVVHTWMYHADFLGGLAALIAKIPKIIWCIRHSDLSQKNNKKITLIIVKLCAWLSRYLPNSIVVCSRMAKEEHIKKGYNEKKMILIPNGFDLSIFKPNAHSKALLREELNLNSDTKLVGMIGRYHPVKNHKDFLAAAAAVVKSIDNIHFILAGKEIHHGNLDLFNEIKKNRLEDVLHLLGPRGDIPIIMPALDLLVSSSWGEGFSNVIGEAMACEVPCVATNVGDSSEIISNTGLVVPVGDVKALANSIIDLLSKNKFRKKIGRNARKRVEQTYEIKVVTQKFEGLYTKVLEE